MNGFSIIVPSFNQEQFIRETLENLAVIKKQFSSRYPIQTIVVDNCSNENIQSIFNAYSTIIDELVIEKDNGQYDAINKGLKLVRGDYWTWLNTDDLIDVEGFGKIIQYLEKNSSADYIYGDVSYIDERSVSYKDYSSGEITFEKLVNGDASISQPGSFFRTAFTNKIGDLAPYHFAFDYEYILRCFKNNAVVHKLDVNVAYFRYYKTSKSGSQDHRFLSEQLKIAKLYGNKPFSKLRVMLNLRILKRKLFN